MEQKSNHGVRWQGTGGRLTRARKLKPSLSPPTTSLADALILLGPQPGLTVRVVGSGPERPELQRLRSLPGVTVDNRWIPEPELGELLAWSDVVVLPYREASQSGVASLALSAGRHVVATRVGGLPEQLGGHPLARLCDVDAGDLAEAIGAVLRLPRPIAGAAALDTDPGWQEMARTLLAGIEDLRLATRGSHQD